MTNFINKITKLAVLTAGLLAAVPMARAEFQPYAKLQSLDPNGIYTGSLLVGTLAGLVISHKLLNKKRETVVVTDARGTKDVPESWVTHYLKSVGNNFVTLGSCGTAYLGASKLKDYWYGAPQVAPVNSIPVEFTLPVEVAPIEPVIAAPMPISADSGVQQYELKGFRNVSKIVNFYRELRPVKNVTQVEPQVIQVPEVIQTPVITQPVITQIPVVQTPGKFEVCKNYVASTWNSLNPMTQNGIMVGAGVAALATGMYAYNKYTKYKQYAAQHDAELLRNRVFGVNSMLRQAEINKAKALAAENMPDKPGHLFPDPDEIMID